VQAIGQTYLAEPETDGDQARTLRPLDAFCAAAEDTSDSSDAAWGRP
jgi:hypothetical protein